MKFGGCLDIRQIWGDTNFQKLRKIFLLQNLSFIYEDTSSYLFHKLPPFLPQKRGKDIILPQFKMWKME